MNDTCYEVFLNYNCNAKCRFCSQGDFDKSLNAPLRDILRRILIGKKKGYARLGLSGGEPLINKDIVKIVAFSKAAGFGFIRIQTNGLMLADKKFASAIARAGLTYCKFTGESKNPALNDYLMGVKGGLGKLATAIENMRRLEVRLGMNILITRKNLKGLAQSVKFFMDKGISDFVLIFPRYSGGMVSNFKELGVSLAQAVPKITQVFRMAGSYGVSAICLNVPPCFMRGYSAQAVWGGFNTIVTDVLGNSWSPDTPQTEEKVFGKICSDCALKKECGGAHKDYIDIFGWSGFKAARRRPADKTPAKGKKYLTDNERCFIKILGIKNRISTDEVLKLAKGIPLCKDCSDGNAVISAGEKLISAGIVKRTREGALYYWELLKK
ncbi:MAG: radical SAM protein [Elusimicrobia bacterium]|nr:radical SAM protein [Elusimicrobiota bacterium]